MSLVGVTGIGVAAKAAGNSKDEKSAQNVVYDQDVRFHPCVRKFRARGCLAALASSGRTILSAD